jgi:hypothetical protein
MITCDQCGKVKGHGEVGTNWICEDCKISDSGDSDAQNDTIDTSDTSIVDPNDNK